MPLVLQNPLSARTATVQRVAFSAVFRHLFHTFILTARFPEKQPREASSEKGLRRWVYRCRAESVWKGTLKLSVSVFQGGDLTGWALQCFSKNLGNFILHCFTTLSTFKFPENACACNSAEG